MQMPTVAPRAWINVGLNGTFAESGILRTTPGDLDSLETALAAAPEDRIVLHFHGGLVREASGQTIAERMARTYAGSGAVPVTMVWETGVCETLIANLHRLHDTEVVQKLFGWVLEKAAAQLGLAGGAKGGGGASAVDHKEVELALRSEHRVAELDEQLAQAELREGSKGGGRLAEEDLDAVERDVQLELIRDLESDPELLDLLEEDATGSEPVKVLQPKGAKGVSLAAALFIAKVAISVVRRHLRGTDHDPYPTAVEELLRAAYLADLGKWAWDGMKIVANDMWQDDGPQVGLGGHVGGYLLRRLERLQGQRTELTVDLVGHSAGAIAICHMLNAIARQGRQIRIRNVVFLAPACRLDLFAEALARRRDRSARFRVFMMTDEYEKLDKLVPVFYPRSLLYFVSGALEDVPDAALAGLARHLGGVGPTAGQEYDDVRRWLSAEDRLVYAPSVPGSLAGLASAALAHGAFDDDPDTLQSLIALARM
jgi:Alpha/beta hydrolase of unknown function (DUF900)